MSTGDTWLDNKHAQILPDRGEEETIREALDGIEGFLEKHGGPFRIAERYPCGSFAKSTMLAGRKEADLVIVLAEPPSDGTLSELAALLHNAPSVENAKVLYKAVAVAVAGGIKLDLLPVAKEGVTAPGDAVPEKLRHALSGKGHVEWFKKNAHETAIHPTVRLLKAFRDCHSAWRSLGSFALEVLAVEVLRNLEERGLVRNFREVLAQIAGGRLGQRPLADPMDPENDLLARLSPDDCEAIAGVAQRALGHIDNDTWSAVFSGAKATPAPATSLGGRTLA